MTEQITFFEGELQDVKNENIICKLNREKLKHYALLSKFPLEKNALIVHIPPTENLQ